MIQALIIFPIILAAFSTDLQYTIPSYKVEDVVWWVEKAGIIGILLTIIFYWVQQRDNKNKEISEDKALKRRACTTLLQEIKDHKDAFTHGYTRINPDPLVNFIITYFNTDAYHSLLNSGLFTHLEEETQIELANLYIRIENQNEDIRYRSRFRDLYFLLDKSGANNENWLKAIRAHEERITRWQTQIQKLSNSLEIRVTKEKQKYQE